MACFPKLPGADVEIDPGGDSSLIGWLNVTEMSPRIFGIYLGDPPNWRSGSPFTYPIGRGRRRINASFALCGEANGNRGSDFADFVGG